MAAWAAAARQAGNLSRFSAFKSASTTKQGALLIQRRGLAGGGDHHGPPKVNFWQDPMSPSKWKEEHELNLSSLLLVGDWPSTEVISSSQRETKRRRERKLVKDRTSGCVSLISLNKAAVRALRFDIFAMSVKCSPSISSTSLIGLNCT